MPRRGGSSRSRSPSSGSRSSFAGSRPMRQNPTSQQSSASYKSPGMMGGLGSTIMTGMAFGAGSQVAHNIVRGMTGSGGQSYVENQEGKSVQQQPMQYQNQAQTSNPCLQPITQLTKCLETNNQNISECQSLFDNLRECRRVNNV